MRCKKRNGVIAGVAMIGCLLAGAASADPPETVLSQGGGIKACLERLGACNGDLSTCDANLGTCDANLGTCDANLGTCDANLDTCNSHLDQCLMSEGDVFPGDGAGNGAPLTYEECADGLTVADLNTGLLWERKVEGETAGCVDENLHRVRTFCSWTDSNGGWIDAVNAEFFAGFSDWRVPHVKELQSIVDYGEHLPAIDPTFPGETQWDRYWSATPVPDSIPEAAWFVNFDGGTVFTTFQSIGFQVRAVRSGPCP